VRRRQFSQSSWRGHLARDFLRGGLYQKRGLEVRRTISLSATLNERKRRPARANRPFFLSRLEDQLCAYLELARACCAIILADLR
jgi:hypothetical protein